MEFLEKSKRIVDLKKEVAEKVWELSSELKQMKESNEFLCEYGSWTEYLVEGVDISPLSATKLMVLSNFERAWDFRNSLLISVENQKEQVKSVVPKKKVNWW